MTTSITRVSTTSSSVVSSTTSTTEAGAWCPGVGVEGMGALQNLEETRLSDTIFKRKKDHLQQIAMEKQDVKFTDLAGK